VFDYISGWEKEIGGQLVVQEGRLRIFANDDGRGGWRHRPNTILVDSQQLESGDAMSDEFKQFAAREIEEFKAEYRQRFPGRDSDELTDEDLLREVMNTVGKPGRLGEHVRCVVSVSMLTEGWDANTVTHILGVRAFGTQLLGEHFKGFPSDFCQLSGITKKPATSAFSGYNRTYVLLPIVGYWQGLVATVATYWPHQEPCYEHHPAHRR
jgi:type III restriction enzyme